MQKTRHYKKNISGFSVADVFVARAYDRDMQQKLHRFKFAHNYIDSMYFKLLFSSLIRESGLDKTSEYIVIYPPISLKDRIFRGPNHAKNLAVIFASILGSPRIICPFRKKFFAGHQSKRKKGERKRVEGEYFLLKNQEKTLRNKEVILIDDIITTGYTTHTLGKLLRGAGVGKIRGFFLSSKKVQYH